MARIATHILDLIHGKVSIRRNANLLRLDIHNHQQRVRCVALEEFVDFQIRGPQLRARVIPPNQLLTSIDLLEHVPHRLDKVVI